MGQQFGDTTLTKVFVGGLAWETQKDALLEHFEKYGEILEAVIISDKVSGRSKGYGFVTFKDAEAAKKACEDATPVINGRRANCNLASLGAKRGGGLRLSPPSTPAPLPSRGQQHPAGIAVGSRGVPSGPPAAPWYYPHPSGTPPPAPFPLHQYPQGLFPMYATAAAAYGYSPNYMAELGYNAKLSPTAGGGYYQGQFSYPAQGGGIVAAAAAAANTMVPVYPLYHFQHHHHQSQGMGIPAHFFPPATATAMATIPAIISTKPTAIPPPATVCVAVEQVKGAS
ncbi:hypothetical protein Cni_G25056 [Canna indica]|uniref:RRM domain-containing protein n=1 Tax=Canna indica TaxID=4628 RepID=A0AAQ3KWW8_9LILI|nr:hypothetical protein Cni_G25056 [Canna indica]